jgi:hypothetical protein
MKTVILAISHIKRDDTFLFRKKPDGTLPYKETWYGFGTEINSEKSNVDTELCNHIERQTGIKIKVAEHLWWDTETKLDLEGTPTFYVYLHTVAEYVSGELTLSENIEKLEWVNVADISEYDIVPPSKAFLARYLKSERD